MEEMEEIELLQAKIILLELIGSFLVKGKVQFTEIVIEVTLNNKNILVGMNWNEKSGMDFFYPPVCPEEEGAELFTPPLKGFFNRHELRIIKAKLRL